MKSHGRARVLRSGLAAAMVAALLGALLVPSSAGADPIGDAKAQAAALAEQINADAHQVDLLSDQYDGAEYHLSQVQQQLATAAHQLQVAQVTDKQNLAALGNEAVVAYMQGGFTPAENMTLSGSTDLSVAQGYFELATGNQVDALDRLRQSEQALRQEQAALQVARQSSLAALSQVTSSKQAVQAAASATQAELAKVQGNLVQLVAQQQAAMAAQEQASERASLIAVQAKLSASSIAAAASTTAGSTKVAASATVGSTKVTAAVGVSLPSIASPPTTTRSAPPPAPPPSSGAAAAIAYAKAQIGKPYQWGAAGPSSFDCSGLTMMAWAAGGVSLPHFSGAQYADTAHVPIADLEPGDLVFFYTPISHVGIYVGGDEMIDAPDTGSFVRYDSIFFPGLQPYGGRP